MNIPVEKHCLIIDDRQNRRIVNLESKTCTIGRDPCNAIVLDSPKISRFHATLLRIAITGTDTFQFRIIDGNLKGKRSTNGFSVNGSNCFSHDLQDGDVIKFGDRISAIYQKVELAASETPSNPEFYSEEGEDSYATHVLSGFDGSGQKSPKNKGGNRSQIERQTSIQQSLERLASFPELFSDPIVEIDLQGNITYLNPAALKEFPQLKIDKLEHPLLKEIIPLIKFATKTHIVREVKIDGKIYEQSVHLISASQLVRCYISDITKRKKAELLLKKAHQELEKRVQQRTSELAYNNEILKQEIGERKQVEQEMRLLQTITQAITEAPNFNEAIAITLRQVCETVGWSYGEAWIPDEQDNVLKLSPAWYGQTKKLANFREASQQFDFAPNVSKPGRVWATKKPEWTENISLKPESMFLREKLTQHTGLKNALGVPIIANDEVIAVFVFFDFMARSEDRSMVNLVTSVAAQLGLIVERKKAEDSLLSSMATNKAILDAIPDLILRIDRNGIVVNYKAASTPNLLMPEREFVGKPIQDVFSAPISDQMQDCLAQAFATKEVQCFECQVPTSNSDKIYSYEVRIAKSDIDEVMAIVRDITERKQAEEDIRRTLEQEKKLHELKSRFVTMTSHEFRTPLASILSSSELLEHYGHKWTEEKKHTHLDRIQSSVKQMTELLNDVLLLGKADSGKLTLNPIQIDLVEFCQDLVEEIQLITPSHRIILKDTGCFAATSTQCPPIYLDEKMLRHILTNLLSNAIKYSPQSDRINFEVKYEAEQAVFKIQDFGIGIPPEEQHQLFESFHRANNVGSIPGTGLGLPIVKRSVDLHGGTISMESKLGEGTTFTVHLPCLNC